MKSDAHVSLVIEDEIVAKARGDKALRAQLIESVLANVREALEQYFADAESR